MSTDADSCLQQAMHEHQQGNLYDADLLYAQTLQLDPDNTRALRLKGILTREQGDIGGSLQLFNRAIQLAPTDPEPMSEIALSHMAAGELTEAEHALRQTLAIAPDSTKALTNLGALLQQRGHIKEAIAWYRQVLELEPDDIDVRCNMAKALSDAGEHEQALKECETALNQSDGHPYVLAMQGAVLLDQERYADARDVLIAATRLTTDDDMALVNLALANYQLGDIAAASDTLTSALEMNPNNARAVADLANCQMAADNLPAAISLCEHFLSLHPGERLVVGAYALALHNAGNEAAANDLTDCDRLMRTYDIALPAGFNSLTDFNQALADQVRNDSSLLANPVSKSTFGGDQTGELDMQASPALQALNSTIDELVSDAAEAHRQAGLADHPIMASAGEQQTVRAWGTLLRAGGGQTAHMHPLGWLSGVYYVHIPPDMGLQDKEAGWLEFNRPPKRFHCIKETPTHRVEPREGRLILFPSWFWHQTLPFKSTDNRISIAFDVVPVASLRML